MRPPLAPHPNSSPLRALWGLRPLIFPLLLALSPLLTSAQTGPQKGIPATNYIIESNPNVSSVSLDITTQDYGNQNYTAPYLYGLMHEDISHSGDGGIYAELLINRAFQGSPVNASDNPVEPYGPSLTGWYAIGDVSLALDRLHPLSSALPNSLALTIGKNASGQVGLFNTGWWGIDVSPQTYNVSFFVNAVNNTYLANQTTTFDLTLRSNLTDDVWATSSIDAVAVDTFQYVQLNGTIENNATAPDANNTFAITFDAEALRGQTLYFALFSLFPETFKNRPNGLRKDLGEAFNAMRPGFLRFPGGNNLEGNSIQQRFKWWETLGPLRDRPGRIGTWGYYNTEGLGLMEYLYWCEDMGAEPLLAVYAGYSLDGTSYPEGDLDGVVQEALDEIEFVVGDVSTKWGGYRAQLGHPEPFNLRWVEIGNEDTFSCTYPYRFPYLYKRLKEAYPAIRFISTAFNENAAGGYNSKCNWTISLPEGSMDDVHNYQTPSFYLNNFDFFDNWLPNNNLSDVEILIGEYSVFQLDTSTQYVNFTFPYPTDIHPAYPQLIHALGEAVYLLAAERNSNLVKLTTYAPILQNRNSYVWTPNLISFEAQQNRTVLSTSYWLQTLFNRYRGDSTVEVRGEVNPLFWVGSVDNSTQAMYLKIVNTSNRTIDVSFTLDQPYSSVNGTWLQSDDPNAFNFINNQTAVVPREMQASELPIQGSSSGSSSGSGQSSGAGGSSSTADEAAASSTATSMSADTTTTTSMSMASTMTTSANGQGAGSFTSSAGATASAGAQVRRNNDGGGSGGSGGSSASSGGSSGGGGSSSTWTWNAQAFSITVLQFNL